MAAGTVPLHHAIAMIPILLVKAKVRATTNESPGFS